MSKGGGGGGRGPSAPSGGGAKAPATPTTRSAPAPSAPKAPAAPAQRPATQTQTQRAPAQKTAAPQRPAAAPAQKAPTAPAQKAPSAPAHKTAAPTQTQRPPAAPAQKAPATQAQQQAKAPAAPAQKTQTAPAQKTPSAPAHKTAAPTQTQRPPAVPAQKTPATQAQQAKAPAAPSQKTPSAPAQKAPAAPAHKTAPPTQTQRLPATTAQKTAPPPNKIEHEATRNFTAGGKPMTAQKSTQVVPPGGMHNVRSTPEGQRADAAARRKSGGGDGQVASHRFDAASNPPANDPKNLTRGNAIQNNQTKKHVETQNKEMMKAHPTATAHRDSTVIHSTTKPGYGDKKHVAENFSQRMMENGKPVIKDGKPVQSNVAFANTKSSAEREIERAKAQGKTVSRDRVNELNGQDRRNFGSVKTDQARAAKLNAAGGAGSAPDKAAMARIMAQQAPNSNVVPIRSQQQGRSPKMP